MIVIAVATAARPRNGKKVKSLALGDCAFDGAYRNPSSFRHCRVGWVTTPDFAIVVKREPPQRNFVDGAQVGVSDDPLLPCEIRVVFRRLGVCRFLGSLRKGLAALFEVI